MGRKPTGREPKATLGAIVPPEFETMVVIMAQAMDDRKKGWLGARLMVRGYLAILEGERLLSDKEIKEIIADRSGFERILTEAKELLAHGIPSDRPKMFAQTFEIMPTETSANQRCLAEIDMVARNLLARSQGSEITMEQAAKAIIRSLEAAGDKLLNTPGGTRIITADEWADEDTGPDVINRSIESYSPSGE
jgi:hypothetical protein